VIADSDGRVAAYYALATGAVARDFVPGPIRRNATDPIPALVIGRLAVDLRCQEQGLARVLVKDALTRCLRVREHAGFALVLVNPVDAVAERFWARWRFRPLPGDAHTMYLPTDGLAKVAVLAGRMTPAPPDRISPVG
jgi:GNAT superfamily N-acetyltransferase